MNQRKDAKFAKGLLIVSINFKMSFLEKNGYIKLTKTNLNDE